MSVTAPESRAEQASFELRATTFTLPTLRLFAGDLAALSQFLEPKIAQAPEFFRNAPVVVDLTHLPTEVALDFPLLVGVLRGLGMLPIGVRGGSAAHRETAQLMDLAILSQGSRGPAAATAARPVPAQPAAEPAASAASAAAPGPAPLPLPGGAGKIVSRPVRSGQRVYAQGGDLVVLAAVSSGAELMADGHIHVYGALRGRALAGVKGNAEARIFCSDLRAELVSVAGHYRVSENLDPALAGRPVQVALRDARLVIEAL